MKKNSLKKDREIKKKQRKIERKKESKKKKEKKEKETQETRQVYNLISRPEQNMSGFFESEAQAKQLGPELILYAVRKRITLCTSKERRPFPLP